MKFRHAFFQGLLLGFYLTVVRGAFAVQLDPFDPQCVGRVRLFAIGGTFLGNVCAQQSQS